MSALRKFSSSTSTVGGGSEFFSEVETTQVASPRPKAPAPAPSSAFGEEELCAQARLSAARRKAIELEGLFLEDYERQLNPSSRSAFEHFIFENNIRLPMLGADESGILIGTWKHADELLSIRFSERFAFEYALTWSCDGALVRDWGRGTVGTFLKFTPEALRIVSPE
jgi:hypothetical protein